ncbi:MAG: RsmE family RNA methyltransferase [Coriobacteriia bacterium]|nr:RsmE family RNA methyltransferase [Coriobacteriia bacterium]
MSAHRFFLTAPLPETGVLPLSAEDEHHLRVVLRLTRGDEIVVVGTDARAALVRLTSVGDHIEAELVAEVPAPVLPRLTLVQGICKGEKMDLVVRQATELGVERVVPLQSSRGVVRLDDRKRVARQERWQRIAEQAAKQSQQVRIPQIAPVTDLVDLEPLLATVKHTLVCWEEASGVGIGDTLASRGANAADAVAIVVGPEGGFCAEEVDALVAYGGVAVSLGETVLRTETAGTVASAIALYELGGLGGAYRG